MTDTLADFTWRKKRPGLLLVLLTLGACTYNLDTPAMQDLRERQRMLESNQTTMTQAVADLERKQAEADAKLRVMWTHGVTK